MAITSFSSARLEPQISETPRCQSPAPVNVPPPGSGQSGQASGRSEWQQREGDTGWSTSVTGQWSENARTAQTTHCSTSTGINRQLYHQRTLANELLCEGRAALKSAMSVMVEREMKAAYGDLWLDIVCRKPLWSPHDLICIMQKHWIAVFTLKFENAVKPIIDDLEKELRPWNDVVLSLRNVQVCLHNCLVLATEINKISPCPDSVKDLERVIQKGTALQQDSTRTSTPTSQLPPLQFSSGKKNYSTASSEPPCSRRAVKRPAPAMTSSSTSSSSLSSAPTTVIASSSTSTSRTGKATAAERRQNVKKHQPVTDTKPLSAHRKLTRTEQRTSPPQSKVAKLQIPQSNTAEENTVIGDVFQGIWSVLFNCCDNVEKMMGSSSEGGRLSEVKETLRHLLPHMVQLYEAFKKCLAFSPCVLEERMDSFSELCCYLNSFFDRANIPATPLPSIAPASMILFMKNTNNRVPLLTGLEQLDDLVGRMQQIISLLPSNSPGH